MRPRFHRQRSVPIVRFTCPTCGSHEQPTDTFTIGTTDQQPWWFTVCTGCNLPTGDTIGLELALEMQRLGCAAATG